jgi:hypothetical protein
MDVHAFGYFFEISLLLLLNKGFLLYSASFQPSFSLQMISISKSMEMENGNGNGNGKGQLNYCIYLLNNKVTFFYILHCFEVIAMGYGAFCAIE